MGHPIGKIPVINELKVGYSFVVEAFTLTAISIYCSYSNFTKKKHYSFIKHEALLAKVDKLIIQ